MTRKLPLLAAMSWLMLSGPANLSAQTARELFDALPTTMRADAEAKHTGKLPPGTVPPELNYLLSFFRNARDFLDNGDEGNAIQQLRQLENAATTDPLREACEAIITKFRKEHTDRETAAGAELAGVLQRAGKTVLAAKTPQDLDPVLRDLGDVTEKRTASRALDRGVDPANYRLQNAVRFVTRWQDYLLALNRNDSRSATEQLRSLVSETETFQVLNIPRSEIVSRIPPANPPVVESTPTPAPAPKRVFSAVETDAAIEAALDHLKTLDDVAPVLRDLKTLSREMSSVSGSYGSSASDLNNVLTSLEELQESYLEVQTGVNRWQGAWFSRYNNTGAPRGRTVYIVLRAQLFALTLPRILGGSDTEKPAPGERVDAFLERLIAEAKKRGDWEAVARGIECRHYLATNAAYETNPAEYSNETAAFKEFFAGQNFEQAAQYEQAVAAYLTALGSGSQEIPVGLISERLAAVKKAHPAEYGGGERATSPTGSVDYRAIRRFYRAGAGSAPEDSTDAPEAGTLSAPPPTPPPSPTPTPAATPSAPPKPSS